MTQPDNYRVPAGATNLTLNAPGVLANDVDPDGDALQASVVTMPTQGTLNPFGAGGGFVYEGWGNFTGVDSFEYVANDGTDDSAPTLVQIDIHAANQPTVAVDDIYSTPENTPLVVPDRGLLANDSDPDNDWLVATFTSVPQHGSLSLGGNGGFIYTPDANFFGTDSFTYFASDGVSVSDAKVTINVTQTNFAPVANSNTYTTPPGATLSIAAPGVLDNDSDPEGHTLSAQPFNIPQHGVLALRTDGSFVYVPDSGFIGVDSFTYTASDGVLDSSPATVSITVQAANQAPVASDDQYGTPQDTVLNVAAPGLLDNDNDPDGNRLDVVIVSQPANGQLALAVQAGGFSYTPDPGFAGEDSFTYMATDGHLDSNVATVKITVTGSGTNSAPVANDDAFSTPQDTRYQLLSPGVLDNDSDPDGDTLRATLVSPPQHGTLSLLIDGGVNYLPDAGFSGMDSFTYTATDGHLESNTATVTITVTANNQPPVANDDAYSTPQDTDLVVPSQGVLDNDSDPEGHTLYLSVIGTDPTNGTLSPQLLGGFRYTPNPGFTGVDSFTYRASDTHLDSDLATVRITVTPAISNQPPVAVADQFTTQVNTPLSVAHPGVLANDSDPQGHDLKMVLFAGPLHGSLSPHPRGGFTYRPDPGFRGHDSFQYKATDGHLDSNIVRVSIIVGSGSASSPTGFTGIPTLDVKGLGVLLAMFLLLGLWGIHRARD